MDELVVFKKKIREQLKENDIIIYKFPREEDEPESQIDVNNNLPFAVVGSNVMIEDDLTGRKFRGRKYSEFHSNDLENKKILLTFLKIISVERTFPTQISPSHMII